MGLSQKGRPDELLFVQWRGGDAAAGDELAARHYAGLHRFFANKAPTFADDLVQATFLACMTVAIPSEPLRSFRGLLFAVARIRLLRHFQKRGQLRGEQMMSRVSLADLGTTPTQRIARDQSRALLQQALAILALDDQITVELYYWQKLSVGEIATTLGITPGGTRAKLHRARQRLRAEYERLSGGGRLEGFGSDPAPIEKK